MYPAEYSHLLTRNLVLVDQADMDDLNRLNLMWRAAACTWGRIITMLLTCMMRQTGQCVWNTVQENLYKGLYSCAFLMRQSACLMIALAGRHDEISRYPVEDMVNHELNTRRVLIYSKNSQKAGPSVWHWLSHMSQPDIHSTLSFHSSLFQIQLRFYVLVRSTSNL